MRMGIKTSRERIVVTVAAAVLVACCPGPILAARSSIDLSGKDMGSSETELGNLVADSIRAQVRADIGFVAASELKETVLAKGEVSAEDIAGAIAYRKDPVVVLTLRGEQVQRALERSVSIYPQKNLGFLQVSGLKFTFDPARPKDSRVVSVSIGGKPLDSARLYSAAVTSSLANGALGYFRVWDKEQITSVTKTSISQAVENYLKDNPQLGSTKGRITVAG